MRKNIILTAAVFMLFLCAQSVRAEMFSFSKSMGGTISDVRPDAISLSPQSGAAPVNLEINTSTKLKDMQAVTELKKGDAIQVRYKEQDGKKIAVQVEKDSQAAATAASIEASSVPADNNINRSKNAVENQSIVPADNQGDSAVYQPTAQPSEQERQDQTNNPSAAEGTPAMQR